MISGQKLVASRSTRNRDRYLSRQIVRYAASFGSFCLKITKTRCVSDNCQLWQVRHAASFGHFGKMPKSRQNPHSMQRFLRTFDIFAKMTKSTKNPPKPLHGMEVFPPPNHGRRPPKEALEASHFELQLEMSEVASQLHLATSAKALVAKMGPPFMGRYPSRPK